MLVFDFENTVNGLPRLTRINKSNLRSVRSSQFSYSPLTTRFVIDFTDEIPVFTTEQKDNFITITFKPTSIPSKKTIATSSSKKINQAYFKEKNLFI